jgi:UDP-glucose 4-epimerase
MRFIVFLLFTSILSLDLLAIDSEEHSTKSILVVGGAGYIGSHVNEMLQEKGYCTIVLDNLSNGYREAVLRGTFIEGDISDTELLDKVFKTYPIDGVIHLAALKSVGESVAEPLKYYKNNVCNTLNLLEAMKRHEVKVFVFSSSAAIFGVPVQYYMDEEHPCCPINPYGQSKYMIETVLKDLDRAYGLRYSCLRYFNAAGGDPRGKIRNYYEKESNIIPLVLRKLLSNDPFVTIFGVDYPTHDGTCIRDYIHIEDLGAAHIAALERLFNGSPSACYNLGNGKGFSVREVLAAIEKVTGEKINVYEADRRLGDPATLVASSKKAELELNWHPKYSSLEMMIEHAWKAMH